MKLIWTVNKNHLRVDIALGGKNLKKKERENRSATVLHCYGAKEEEEGENRSGRRQEALLGSTWC